MRQQSGTGNAMLVPDSWSIEAAAKPARIQRVAGLWSPRNAGGGQMLLATCAGPSRYARFSGTLAAVCANRWCCLLEADCAARDVDAITRHSRTMIHQYEVRSNMWGSNTNNTGSFQNPALKPRCGQDPYDFLISALRIPYRHLMPGRRCSSCQCTGGHGPCSILFLSVLVSAGST